MKYSYNSLFKRFQSYLRPYRGKFIAGTLVRLISAVLGLYHAYAIATIITFVINYQIDDDLSYLYLIFALWVASFLLRYILVYYAKMWCIGVGQQATLDIEKGALKHLSQLDNSWHEIENVGNKLKRIQRGSGGILTLSRVWVVNIIDIVVNFIGAFIIIAHFDLVLAVLVVIYQLIYYVIASTLRKRTVIASRQKNIKDEEANGLMFEIIANIRSVKVLGMASPLLEHVQRINAELIVLMRKNINWYHLGVLARSSWQGIARTLLFGFVIYGIFRGQYEVGFLVLFYGYFNTLSTSIDELSSAAQDIAIAKTDLERLAELFDVPVVIETEEGKVPFPKEWDGIHIRNLSFSYGNNLVLSNIDLDIKKGEKIGIVGLSGAGKSTLFKLLLKEHEGSGQDIFIGGTSLKDISKSDYIKHVAVVLQETEAFNMSLHENVVIAHQTLSLDESAFKKALKISHVDDFLHKLPQGIDTLIGEKGVKLSGGEKQRLGIARAVFKNPEILFLDEATSHLDVESEQKIQDSLAQFFNDVTAIVIAHRLSTIKEMDRIIVIQHGKIIETGTFDELYKNDGRFREFWDMQQA